MPGLKDIKRRIKSVKNTKKITYAMKLVSAAKLKKAQDAVKASREYTDALGELLANLSRECEGADFSHPLMEAHTEVKKVRLVVVGGSRGLCGGYNTNVNKRIVKALDELGEKHPGAIIETVILGKKPAEFYRLRGMKYIASHEDLPEDANLWPIDDICLSLESDFLKGEIDEAYLLYTQFRSAMSQSLRVEKLLPMDSSSSEEEGTEFGPTGLTLFEPSPEKVFEQIVPRILRTKVRQGGLDAKASEHGSRMVAMDSATKNAGELGNKLQLKHNKLRQGAITAELLDIIGGAEAVD